MMEDDVCSQGNMRVIWTAQEAGESGKLMTKKDNMDGQTDVTFWLSFSFFNSFFLVIACICDSCF